MRDLSHSRYIHHFEHEDGSVVSLHSPFQLPTQQFVAAMENQWYTYLHTTANPEI